MNAEQVEAHLREYQNQLVAVILPIRGTVHLTYYGNLTITESMEQNNKFYLYSIRYWPDVDINFRSQDVLSITPLKIQCDHEPKANILLNTEDWVTEKRSVLNI